MKTYTFELIETDKNGVVTVDVVLTFEAESVGAAAGKGEDLHVEHVTMYENHDFEATHESKWGHRVSEVGSEFDIYEQPTSKVYEMTVAYIEKNGFIYAPQIAKALGIDETHPQYEDVFQARFDCEANVFGFSC